MVGIGGGTPMWERDVYLSDVVVSVPWGKLGGMIQYDFRKRLSDSWFQQTSQLNALQRCSSELFLRCDDVTMTQGSQTESLNT